MFKKYGIITIFLLSLLVIAGCGKVWVAGTSSNLQKCHALCDKEATMYKAYWVDMKTQCYSNCQEIEAINQKWGNTEQTDTNTNKNESTTTNEESTTTNGETTTTNEEVMTNADCDNLCRSAIWLTASAEERKSCVVSCKAEIRVQSKDVSDCNNIETESEGLITEYSCIASKAINQKNPTYCAKIDNNDDRDVCYVWLAQELSDKSLCNKISNEENKVYCNMIFTQE